MEMKPVRSGHTYVSRNFKCNKNIVSEVAIVLACAHISPSSCLAMREIYSEARYFRGRTEK